MKENSYCAAAGAAAGLAAAALAALCGFFFGASAAGFVSRPGADWWPERRTMSASNALANRPCRRSPSPSARRVRGFASVAFSSAGFAAAVFPHNFSSARGGGSRWR